MTSQFVLSVSLLICGFVVKAFPQYIAGYYLLSDEERSKIDIKRLSLFLKQIFIGLGILSFLLFLVLDGYGIKLHNIFTVNITLIILALVAGSIYANSAFKK